MSLLGKVLHNFMHSLLMHTVDVDHLMLQAAVHKIPATAMLWISQEMAELDAMKHHNLLLLQKHVHACMC